MEPMELNKNASTKKTPKILSKVFFKQTVRNLHGPTDGSNGPAQAVQP